MRILIAEDVAVCRLLLREALTTRDYEVVVTTDGDQAWAELQKPDAPQLAILDWEMPGLSGPEVCRKVRAQPADLSPYLVLLTGRDKAEDVALGLQSGANDYLTKPFHVAELAARLAVAVRTLDLQRSLATRVKELEQALAQVKQLHGMLPICAWCKKIRDDQNYWLQVEDYVARHADVSFSHGICPNCFEREVKWKRPR
jgi:sigma-B regulation protein RsbU (phosphoserine phosphatase)